MVSTAQKVRLWFMLAAIIFGLLGLAVSSAQSAMELGGLATMNVSVWNAMQGGITMGLVSLVTLSALGPITLWRFLRPKIQAAPGSAAAYNQAMQYPPAQPQFEYPQPQPTWHPQYPPPHTTRNYIPPSGRHGRPEGSDQ